MKYYPYVHKIGGAHFKCVNNQLAIFEYKGMKTVGATNYTYQTPPSIFDGKMS